MIEEAKIKMAIIREDKTVVKNFIITRGNDTIAFHLGKTTFAVKESDLINFLKEEK